MRRLITTSLVLLLVTGCASIADSAPEPAAPTPQTTEPSSASTPRTPEPAGTAPSEAPRLGVEEAAVRYLEIVRPYNEALEALETAINTGQPVDVQQEQAAATVTALHTEITELRNVRWPAEVEPHVLALADAGDQAVPSWETAAAATTSDSMVTAVLAALEHDDQAAADAIRRLLALDQYDEGDYSS